MSLRDIFNRNKAKQLDAEPEEGDDTGMMAGNDAVRKKQTMWLAIIAGFIVLLGGWYILKPSGKAAIASTDGKDVTIATDDMVNRNMSQREWQASSEAQMQSINNQLKSVDGQAAQMRALQEQVAALQGQNQSMASDGQRVMSAYQQENDQLRKQLSDRSSTPAPAPLPTQMYGAAQPNYR